MRGWRFAVKLALHFAIVAACAAVAFLALMSWGPVVLRASGMRLLGRAKGCSLEQTQQALIDRRKSAALEKAIRSRMSAIAAWNDGARRDATIGAGRAVDGYDHVITLREGDTPLPDAPRAAAFGGLNRLTFKHLPPPTTGLHYIQSLLRLSGGG